MAIEEKERPASLAIPSGRVFPLVGSEMRIGRGADCDVRIEDATNTISSLHAVVRQVDDEHQLIDESRNGTSVRRGGRGRAVKLGKEPHTLEDGDLIVVMPGVELTFNAAFVPGAKPTKSAKRKGGNKGFLVGGLVMWGIVLGALALSVGGDDAEPETVTVGAVMAELEGSGSADALPEVRDIADFIKSESTGWLRETVLEAAWSERRGRTQDAERSWGQVYVRARSGDMAHQGLAAFALERLDTLKDG